MLEVDLTSQHYLTETRRGREGIREGWGREIDIQTDTLCWCCTGCSTDWGVWVICCCKERGIGCCCLVEEGIESCWGGKEPTGSGKGLREEKTLRKWYVNQIDYCLSCGIVDCVETKVLRL